MKGINYKVLIGGCKQDILVLNDGSRKPLLLVVHGGPGSPDRPLVCKYNTALTDKFTVICWDQRCSGLSYTRQNKKVPLTTELMLSDLKEMVEYLLKKYNVSKLYLAGHSWGAYLGLWFSSKYPQYIYYYVGTGQGISSKLDEIAKYNFVLQKAKHANDRKVIKALQIISPPINGKYKENTSKCIEYVGKLVHRYGGYIDDNNDFSMTEYIKIYLPFYKLNVLKVIKGINYSVKNLIPKMKENDVIPTISKLDVPIKLIFGENDYICPMKTAKTWFDNLSAPKKTFTVIKNAAHMVNFEQPDEWCREVINTLDEQ